PKGTDDEKTVPTDEDKPVPVLEETLTPVEEETPLVVAQETSKPVEEDQPEATEEEKPVPVVEETSTPVDEVKPGPVEEEKRKTVDDEMLEVREKHKSHPVDEEESPVAVEEKGKSAEEKRPKPTEEDISLRADEENTKVFEKEKAESTEGEKQLLMEEDNPTQIEVQESVAELENQLIRDGKTEPRDDEDRKLQENGPESAPAHEAEETTTVTLTVQLPESTLHKEVILLKNNEELNPSEHIKVTKTSPTTIEIQIIRAKPDDEGKYSVLVDGKEQPVMQLKVIPKPVIHQIMELPQTKFKEGETLTIKCQFDTIPEETFEFLRNGIPLTPDDRISTKVEDNTYTITVKDLRPDEDEGVYTLKSDHLILDTPNIIVASHEKKLDTEIKTSEEDIVASGMPEAPLLDSSIDQGSEESPTSDEKKPAVNEIPVVEKKVPNESNEKVAIEPVVEKPSDEVPKDEEKIDRSEIEIPILRVPAGDTITIRVPDSKTTETTELNLYINDVRVTTLDDDESRITIEKDGGTDNYIVVSDTKPEDAGRYSVEFRGNLQSLCMLEVMPARLKKSENEIPKNQVVVENVSEEEEQKATDIPTYEVVEGNSVNLKIEQPTGTDTTQTVLFKNGQKLEPSTRLTILPTSSTTIEINLENVKPDDQGTYSIQFGNTPSQKLMNLRVLAKPVIHDSLRLPKEVFDEGETLTIQCEFDSKPDEPLIWKLNGIPLTQLNDDRITTEAAADGKSYTLTVKDLRPKQHEGVYKLESSHLVLETPFIRVIENVEEEEVETTTLVEDEETESFELQRKPKIQVPSDQKLETIIKETEPENIDQQRSPKLEEETTTPLQQPQKSTPKQETQEPAQPVEDKSKPEPVEEEKSQPVEEEKPTPVEKEKPRPGEEVKPEPMEEEKSQPVDEEKPKPAEEIKPQPVEEETLKPADEVKSEPVKEENPQP
ncbi:unnamed protein product, partial [Rotaria magnacalcarata]